MTAYNQRGGAEVRQFRVDKEGLHLDTRRKQLFAAQKGLILLTDLAHNLLTDFQCRALVGTRFAQFGQKRIVRDLLSIPGRLTFQDGKLHAIDLLNSHANSADLLTCLEKYCRGH